MQQSLEDLSDQIWEHVKTNIAQILKECDLYGLAGVLTIPDPSIENRIAALKRLDTICQAVVDSTTDSQYSVARIMYNAKQQILNLEMLLSAAKNDVVAVFEEIKARLNGQGQH